MKILKIIKRALFDFPTDCWCWIVFYRFRSKKYSPTYAMLEREGVQILHGLITREDVALLQQVADEYNLLEKLHYKGQLRGREYSQGLIDDRLKGITEKFKSIAIIYQNSLSVKLELTYFQLSQQVEEVESIPGGEYHMDDNKPNLKFFVYLSDVGEGNGPFRVVPGTHGLRLSKLFRYFKWSLLKNRSNLYSETDEFRNLDAASVNLVGKKGFCFAADTTAWHRADAVQAGERLVFVASFNHS